METKFFTSVAKHDLERFHSECLAWLFNTKPSPNIYAVEFIKLVLNNLEVSVVFTHVETEVNQLDLVLFYLLEGEEEYRAIIIENKVKATEGTKKIATGLIRGTKVDKEWNSIKEEYKLKCDVESFEFSQTEYYFLRSFDAVFDFEKSVNSSTHHVAKENCKWIYLIPAKVLPAFLVDCQLNFDYDFKKFNNWRDEFGDNPWDTYSYIELSQKFLPVSNNAIINDPDKILARAYVEFIDFKFSEFEDHLKGQFKSYAPTNFGAYEYFRVLKASLEKKGIKNDIIKELNTWPGSSNNGEPILDIIIKNDIIIQESSKIYLKGNKEEIFNIGLQLQGHKLKIFIAAKDYENISISTKDSKEKYEEFFSNRIKKSLLNNLLDQFQFGQFTLSKPRGKSFMNYNTSLKVGQNYSFIEMHNLLYSISEAISNSLTKDE